MIAVIDYDAGNVRSVLNALARQGVEARLTADPSVLRQADKVIFPGVGEASAAMEQLRSKGLDSLIPTFTQPVLGICVGLQLLCAHSEEGNTKGLGIFPVKVKRFPPLEKVPHVGWNDFSATGGQLLVGISPSADMYYVHSYYAEISADTGGTCEYMLPFSATLERDNFLATQFHPEKSGSPGARVIENFLKL